MPWVAAPSTYMPAAGEQIRIYVAPWFLPNVDESDVRDAVASAGYSVYEVSRPLFGDFRIKLAAPGGQTMEQIGQGVANAINELWSAWDTKVTRYERWQFELSLEPSVNQTIALAAIAVIGLVVVYFSRRFL